MNIARIPKSYLKPMLRLKEKEQAFIVISLLRLINGEDVVLPDTHCGDTLEKIWENCMRMEKKNTKVSDIEAGGLVGAMGAAIKDAIVYDSIVKDSIVTPEKSKNKSQPLVESSKNTPEVNVPKNKYYEWVIKNTPTLLNLKTPLTQDQAQWFADNYPEDVWQNVFKQMENWIPLKKKSSSSNLTAQNWLRRDGWFSFERMKEANYYEAKEILCPRAMAIYANKNPQAFNNK